MWLIPTALIWGGVVLFLRVYRVWILFYVVATIGCAYGLTMLARDPLNLDLLLGQSIAWSVHQLSVPLNLPTRIFAGAPTSLLVMVVSQDVGWTLLKVGVESSGLLEMIVFISLLLFYPGQSRAQRARAILIGCGLTWIANVLRVLLIIAMLQLFGKEALVIAHSLVGKGVFFILTISIYWYLLTAPTVRMLGRENSQ
nr:exosortase/archaeosortase family protein [Oscillochloris sp. ZM17-4]